MKVNVLWAGGWDEYEIDPTQTRPESAEEMKNEAERIAAGWGGDPVIGFRAWLRPKFITRAADRPDVPEHTLVKITKYYGGGD